MLSCSSHIRLRQIQHSVATRLQEDAWLLDRNGLRIPPRQKSHRDHIRHIRRKGNWQMRHLPHTSESGMSEGMALVRPDRPSVFGRHDVGKSGQQMVLGLVGIIHTDSISPKHGLPAIRISRHDAPISRNCAPTAQDRCSRGVNQAEQTRSSEIAIESPLTSF